MPFASSQPRPLLLNVSGCPLCAACFCLIATSIGILTTGGAVVERTANAIRATTRLAFVATTELRRRETAGVPFSTASEVLSTAISANSCVSFLCKADTHRNESSKHNQKSNFLLGHDHFPLEMVRQHINSRVNKDLSLSGRERWTSSETRCSERVASQHRQTL